MGAKEGRVAKKIPLKCPLILNLSRKSQYLTNLVTKVFFVTVNKNKKMRSNLHPPPLVSGLNSKGGLFYEQHIFCKFSRVQKHYMNGLDETVPKPF